jgi:3'-phosphoadenosine 5'-phosphosulfate sulfotransferase (PAPS reductase)/FAD synthetase
MKILSLGAGVNSTALLVLKSQGKVDFDCAVFADTGGENPETYQYLEQVIKPFCALHKIPLEVVKREGKDLYQESWERKIIPTRMFRSCTDKFKIRVLKGYVRRKFPDENVVFLVGISSEEDERAKNGCGNLYPLVDLGIDREGCKKIIQDAGLPIPIKSGCYFCPFTPKHGWLNLLKKHPELYKKAEELEKNGQRYPEMTLQTVPLERVRKSIQDQKSMCNFLNSCPMCEVEDNE